MVLGVRFNSDSGINHKKNTMNSYPPEEDPGSCLVKILAIGIVVVMTIPTLAFLAWCVLVTLQLLWQ